MQGKDMLRITEDLEIAEWELTEHFDRSRGPGGQNVNKVNSAVTLRFEAERSPHLSPAVKNRLRRLAGQRWTKDGAVIIQVDTTRNQGRNRELAKQRLSELIRKATIAPKKRIPTRPTRGSVERRLKAKQGRARVKTLRGSAPLDHDQ